MEGGEGREKHKETMRTKKGGRKGRLTVKLTFLEAVFGVVT